MFGSAWPPNFKHFQSPSCRVQLTKMLPKGRLQNPQRANSMTLFQNWVDSKLRLIFWLIAYFGPEIHQKNHFCQDLEGWQCIWAPLPLINMSSFQTFLKSDFTLTPSLLLGQCHAFCCLWVLKTPLTHQPSTSFYGSRSSDW